MSLRIGTTLGAYEVLALEGVGGMGEVYRARDTKLHRDVALKVLPERFAADPHRLARFTREAHILASLNHPNIGAVYGIEDVSHSPALVLEWVDGDTLAERIAQRPIPVDESLAIARQIADALEAAHESGVIHRDLKPSNIKVRPDGTVKVLDFGLAKALDPIEGVDDGELTMTSPVGQVAIVGTPTYMSPEQARGQKVDKRADVWAFGCVLYEMLTGQRAFDRDSTSATLAAVMHGEPDWDRAPANVRPLLHKCLEKDPRNRLRDLGDAMSLVEAASGSSALPPVVVQRVVPWKWTVIALALIAIAVTGVTALREEPSTEQQTRLQIPLPRGFSGNSLGIPVLSPDGRKVAILDAAAPHLPDRRVWVYSLDSGEWRSLSSIAIGPGGTGGAIWSPDGRFLALTTSGRLSKIDVTSDTSQTLCECVSGAPGDWNADGVILTTCDNVVMRVPETGGTPVPLTTLDRSRREIGHYFSRFVDARRFVYLRRSPSTEGSGIFVGSLDAKPEAQSLSRLVATNTGAKFARSQDGARGYLLFMRGTALVAQEISLSSLQQIGDAIRLVERFADGETAPNRLGVFSVSETGMLAYRRSEAAAGTPVWVDRHGRELVSVVQSPLENPQNPRLSPDGGRLVLAVGGDLWVYDLTGKPPVRLTSNAGNDVPLWTPDGKRLVYADNYPPPQRLMSVAADNPNDMPVPASPDGHYHPLGWSRDGIELIAVVNTYSPTNSDLVGLQAGMQGPRPLLQRAAADGDFGAQVSPDGQWLAYTSNITGTREVWVQPYPGPGQPRRVSTNGGTDPQWARNGRELYYIEQSGMNTLMSVPVLNTATFDYGAPTPLFESTYAHPFGGPNSYDVTADGRFLMIKPAPAPSPPINVILNWTAALKH